MFPSFTSNFHSSTPGQLRANQFGPLEGKIEDELVIIIIIIATHFTAAIPNLGYRGIRQIFDKEKINYMRQGESGNC